MPRKETIRATLLEGPSSHGTQVVTPLPLEALLDLTPFPRKRQATPGLGQGRLSGA